MKIESEINRINFSSKDELALEKINYDKNSIKNLNFDFNNLVINKPWGYEYLFYSSKEISIWILNIKKNQKTSMHCHPNKKTSLVLLDGEANFYSLNKKIHIKSGQCVIIDEKTFHKTSSEHNKDIIVMEIETPSNKNDLLRLEDSYNRPNAGYEKKEAFSKINKINNYINYESVKDSNVYLGKCKLELSKNNYEKLRKLNSNVLICPIKLNKIDLSKKIKLGEVYKKNNLEKIENWAEYMSEALIINKEDSEKKYD